MKTNTNFKKMEINKQTIAHLDEQSMTGIHGGEKGGRFTNSIELTTASTQLPPFTEDNGHTCKKHCITHKC